MKRFNYFTTRYFVKRIKLNLTEMRSYFPDKGENRSLAEIEKSQPSKTVLCLYRGIKYNLKIPVDEKYNNITVKRLLTVFGKMQPDPLYKTHQAYDFILNQKYLTNSSVIDDHITNDLENVPFVITDYDLSKEILENLNIFPKNFNPEYQFYLDTLFPKFGLVRSIFKNEGFLKKFISSHDIIKNKEEFFKLLKLMLLDYKDMELKSNYEINIEDKHQKILPLVFTKGDNVVPVIFKQKFRAQSKDGNEPRVSIENLEKYRFQSFDMLKALSRQFPEQKYFIGVISDFSNWAFTLFIRKSDDQLESSDNFLTSKIYSFEDPFSNKSLDTIFTFLTRIVDEKENFHNYRPKAGLEESNKLKAL